MLHDSILITSAFKGFMRELAALEYSYIIKEMQKLHGKHFGNIYTLAGGKYRLKIGNENIMVEPGVRMHFTKYIEETETPDGFAQKVKKELKNSRLLEITQVNDDRIIEMRFENASLIFEMFGKGNVILVEEEKTVAALHYRKWAGREITRGKKYTPPPSNIRKTLAEVLSDRYIIHSLMRLPLGKEYAKELLVRCCIEERKPGDELTEEEKLCLEKETERMLREAKPRVYLDNQGKTTEFGLSVFGWAAEHKTKEFPTLNEAVDEFYFHQKEEESPQVGRIRKRLEKQEERMEELMQKEGECRKKGDFIYEKEISIAQLLEELRNIKLEKIEEKYAKYRAKVNKKERSVEIDITED